MACTFSGTESMTMTSLLSSDNVSATAEPKVPAPITANRRMEIFLPARTPSSYHDVLFPIAEFSAWTLPPDGRRNSKRPHPSEKHYQNQNELSKIAKIDRKR